MDKYPKKIKGVGLVSWLIVVVFIGSIILIGMRLLPPYIESMAVGSSLTSLAEDPIAKYGARSTLVDLLARRFQVNDVKSISANDLKIEKKDGHSYFKLEYEVRVHAIGNIDCVLSFSKSAEVK